MQKICPQIDSATLVVKKFTRPPEKNTKTLTRREKKTSTGTGTHFRSRHCTNQKDNTIEKCRRHIDDLFKDLPGMKLIGISN